jgi:hypothetical protein
MKALPVIAVGVGAALLAVSFLWVTLFPATSAWTDEKSERMSDLGVQAHKLVGQLEIAKTTPSMHGGRSAAEIDAEFKQVNSELAQLRDELQGKVDGPRSIARIFRWAGVVCLAIGAVIMMASRSS